MNKRVLIFLAAVLAVASLMGQVVASEASKPQMKTRMEALEPFIVMGLEAQNAMEGEAMMEAWTKFFSYHENCRSQWTIITTVFTIRARNSTYPPCRATITW